MRRFGMALAAVIAAGCHDVRPLDLPTVEMAAPKATIIAVRTERGATIATAYGEGERPPPTLTLQPGATVIVAHYDRELDALGLTAGAIEFALADDPGRPFPVPQSIFVGRTLGTDPITFMPTGTDHEDFKALRLPARTLETCFESGGCYVRTEDVEPRVCTTPCPDSPIAPAMPATLPELPRFGECSAGWSPRTELAMTYCVPPDRNPGCGAHEAQWIDTSACQRVGTTCPPAGQWSAQLPAGRTVVYVRPGVNGVGTEASPYGSIMAAIQSTTGDRVIALARADYAENVVLEDGVELIGACAEDTTIRAPNGNTIHQEAGRAVLRNLHVAGSQARAIDVFGGGMNPVLSLRDVRATGESTQAIMRAVGPSMIDAEGILLRGRGEAGIFVGAGAQVTARRLLIEMNGLDVWATGAETHLSIEDAAIIEAAGTNPLGGVIASQAATVVLDRALFVGHRGHALEADEGGRIDVSNTYVDGTARGVGASSAIWATEGSNVTVSRTVVSNTAGAGIGATGSTITASDVLVTDGADPSSGIYVDGGGHLELGRVAIVRQPGVGLFVLEVGTSARIEDVLIADTRARSGVVDGTGTGAAFEDGASFVVDRMMIDGAPSLGVIAFSSAQVEDVVTSGEFNDLTIVNIGPRFDGDGIGLRLQGDIEVDIHRVAISKVALHAVTSFSHSDVTIDDLTVEDAFIGVRTNDQVDLRLTRASIQNVRGTGLCVAGDSRVVASEVLLADASSLDDTDDRSIFCAFGVPLGGAGIIVNNIASLDIGGYAIEGAEGIGFSIRGPDSVRSVRGAIAGTQIGLQLAPEVELEEVLLMTTFKDNVVAVESQ